MKNFTKKLSVLIASFAMLMGVGLVKKGASETLPVDAAEEKITDYTKITSGNEYFIGATTSKTDYYFKAFGNTDSSTSQVGQCTNTLDEASSVILEGSDTSWSIKIKSSGLYIAIKTKEDKGKHLIQSAKANFTVSNDTSKNLIKFAMGNYAFQFNASNPRFGSYASTQTNLWLLPVAPSGTLKSDLRLEGEPQKVYAIGESFNPAGLTIYAQYEEEDVADKDVTAQVKWTPTPLTKETTSVTGTYTENDKQATITIDGIEVVDPAEAFIKMVNELPPADEITVACKEKIEAARAAYEALQDKNAAGIAEALTKLEAAEKALQKLTPTLKYTLDTSKDKIATENQYKSYTNSDSNGTKWTVTLGSMQTAGLYLGTSKNEDSRKNLTLDGTNDGSTADTKQNPKAKAIADALGIETSQVGYFGIIQEDKPMDKIGGISISYNKADGTSPEKGYILVSTDNGTTYKKIDEHEISSDTFNDKEQHVHIFTKNYSNALFAVIYEEASNTTGQDRVQAPKFEFYSYPDSTLATKFVELWDNLRTNGNICEGSVDGHKTITKQAELEDLIKKYDDMDESVRTIVDDMTDKTQVTIKENIEYFRALLEWRNSTSASNFDQMISLLSISKNNSNTVAIVAGLALFTALCYAIIKKRRLAD